MFARNSYDHAKFGVNPSTLAKGGIFGVTKSTLKNEILW